MPWQTDEASCESGEAYTPGRFLSTPGFWSARVPNQVLPMEAFVVAGLPELPARQRLRFLDYRKEWMRDVRGTGYLDRLDKMVREWWRVGIVVPMPFDDAHGAGLPASVHVETGRDPRYPGNPDPTLVLAKAIAGFGTDRAGAELAAGMLPPVAVTPPTRTYRRGEI